MTAPLLRRHFIRLLFVFSPSSLYYLFVFRLAGYRVWQGIAKTHASLVTRVWMVQSFVSRLCVNPTLQ